jgi:hypothetical protein
MAFLYSVFVFIQVSLVSISWAASQETDVGTIYSDAVYKSHVQAFRHKYDSYA